MVLQLVLAAGLGGTGNHHLPLCSGRGSGAEGPGIHGPLELTAWPSAAAPSSLLLSQSYNKCVLQGGDCIKYFTSPPVYSAIWECTISQLWLLFISK